MSVVKHAPTFALADAAHLAKELYGLSGSAAVLPSERDQNFLLTVGDERDVLKIANATEEHAMLDAQNQMMAHVAGFGKLFPKVVDSLRGENSETISGSDGRTHFVRLVTYLNGMPLGNVKRHSPELMLDLGRKLGELDNALRSFEHPALHRNFHWDFANGLDIVKKNLKLVRDKKMREMVGVLAGNFEKFTAPLLPRLRNSAIYNDANDYNILVGGGNNIYSFNQNVTFQVVVPAAVSGVIGAVILGMSRAIGETIIVVVAGGTQPQMVTTPAQGGATVTAFIAQVALGDLPFGTLEYNSIFAAGLALLVLTLMFNFVAFWLQRRFREAY